MSKSSPFFSDGGALRNKRNFSLTVVCLIIVATLWNTSSVSGAPAKLDSLESPFPLDLQPPVFEATSSTTSNQGDSGNSQTIDSYGNLIESLQPIQTPDGRKVVSAQGLQFEIPNYASGITELKKPADDLLPPFVGELKRNDLVKTTTARIIEGRLSDNDKQGSDDYADNWVINLATTEQHLSSQVIDDSQPYKLRIKRQSIQQHYQFNTDTNNNNFNNSTPQEQQHDEVLKPQNILNTNTFVANTMTTNKPNQVDQQQQKLTTPTTPYLTLPSKVTDSLSLFVSKQINNLKSFNLNSPLISSPTLAAPSSFLFPTPSSPLQIINSLNSLSSSPKLSAQYAPISNGNFNYPNIPTDPSIIERIASKYKNPLPTIDPIVVALPDDTVPDSFTTNSGSSSSTSAETTTVDVESVPIVEVESDTTTAQSSKSPQFLSSDGKFQGLPSYILDLNDPDIAGPVDYVPDNKGLKVIAWDLLPPFETDAEKDDVQIITHENSTPRTIKGVEGPISHNIKVTLSTGQSDLQSQKTTQGQVSVVDLQNQSQLSQTSQPQLGSRFSSTETTTTKPNYFQQNRGTVHFSSTTPRPTTTTTKRTTTTTYRTTTTPRTTTTTTTTPKTTTTRRSTTPRTTTTTTAEPDTSEFFKLEAGDSYTLPPWLQDIDDPELDAAVTYIVPEDINQYNHTIDRDILPPFEPFTDLNNLHLTPPTTTNGKYSTSTSTTRAPTLGSTTTARTTRATTSTTARPKTTTTTTTKRPALSTSQPHWVRAKPTTKSPTTFNNQFLTNHNQDSDNVSFTQSFNFAQRTTSTTTVKPKTTVNYYNRPSSTTPKTDKIGSSEVRGTAPKTQNPFLPTYDNGAYRPQTTTRRTTTTTTTTTTAAPNIDVNPFEATLPPWLKDFDYPDVGPGVPFVYDPNEDELPVDKDILPPSETSSETNINPTFTKSPTSTSSSSSSFLFNSQTPQGFTNKFSTSATSLTSSSSSSSSSIPSKVNIPLPSIPQQQQEQTNQDQDSTVTQPPLVFVPPPPTAAEDNIVNAKKTSSSFNTNFAAQFDPTTNTITTNSDDPKKIPLGADRESFPPFNNAVTAGDVTGSVTLPNKTIFSKSEDGKVITNNVFLNGGAMGGAATSAKPFATSNAVNNEQRETIATQAFSASTFTKATTAATSFNQFSTTSAGASGFVTAAGGSATSSFGSTSFGASSNGGSKYTGRFGGPPGVLAPQSSGFTTANPVTKQVTYNRPATTTVGFASSASSLPQSSNNKFTGSFGGPPGVFKPYDNVKN